MLESACFCVALQPQRIARARYCGQHWLSLTRFVVTFIMTIRVYAWKTITFCSESFFFSSVVLGGHCKELKQTRMWARLENNHQKFVHLFATNHLFSGIVFANHFASLLRFSFPHVCLFSHTSVHHLHYYNNSHLPAFLHCFISGQKLTFFAVRLFPIHRSNSTNSGYFFGFTLLIVF